VKVQIHVLIRGRIGDAWVDVDRRLKVAAGTTLAQLVDLAAAARIPLREALERSPHLVDTLMLNGERCPMAEHAGRELRDGDELYLLAPLAGG